MHKSDTTWALADREQGVLDLIWTIPAETTEDIVVVIIDDNGRRLFIQSVIDRINFLFFWCS